MMLRRLAVLKKMLRLPVVSLLGHWMKMLRLRPDVPQLIEAEHLPEAGYRAPEATYLGWLDLSAYGWGDTPSRKILDEAKVALNPGPSFGPGGAGFARINFACSPGVLTEAMERIGALAR